MNRIAKTCVEAWRRPSWTLDVVPSAVNRARISGSAPVSGRVRKRLLRAGYDAFEPLRLRWLFGKCDRDGRCALLWRSDEPSKAR